MKPRTGPVDVVLGIVTMLTFLCLYAPLAAVSALSFFQLVRLRGVMSFAPFSLEPYARLWVNDDILSALATTCFVGVVATALALVLGVLFAFYFVTARRPLGLLMQGLIFLPFLLPPIITGLALLIFFREIDFDRSLVTVIIGHTVFVLALVYRTILVRLQGLGMNMIEASYDLGASGWQTFRLVILPNLKSALIGAAILAFALSFDETMITILVTGTDNTLPIRLWAMMRLGFTPDINALVAVILGLTTILVLVAARQLIPKDFATRET